jgi:hypothetical protein
VFVIKTLELSRSAFFDEKSIPFHERFPHSSKIWSYYRRAKSKMLFKSYSTKSQSQTDGRTDRPTDRQTDRRHPPTPMWAGENFLLCKFSTKFLRKTQLFVKNSDFCKIADFCKNASLSIFAKNANFLDFCENANFC